jgi:hypothetical protein
LLVFGFGEIFFPLYEEDHVLSYFLRNLPVKESKPEKNKASESKPKIEGEVNSYHFGNFPERIHRIHTVAHKDYLELQQINSFVDT